MARVFRMFFQPSIFPVWVLRFGLVSRTVR